MPFSFFSNSSTFSSFFSLLLFLFFFHFSWPISAQRRSIPIPLDMDRRLTAGREVYDKQSTPTQNEGVPTSVKLAMYIEGIGSFRTHTMDFQLDVYLQQFWKDPRLAHNESSRILIRDRSILNRIWHPDVYFANARIAQFHEVTQPNFLLWIEPDGSILYDTRVSMIVICAMNLKNFPLDSQWCHLRILSYAYDIHHLLIEWVDTDPITKNMNITMSDMDIVKLIPGTCDGNYSTGVWSCVTAEFFVSRELTHHILQTYVPTTLIVVISWFSFWLDVEAVPARVSLAITTLLTLSTQANSVKNSLPEVSYMKSLDLFLAVSVLFVFGVLIEFTIVNYTQRNATMAAAGLLAEKSEEEEEGENCGLGQCLREMAHRLIHRGPNRWKKLNPMKMREQREQNHLVEGTGGGTRSVMGNGIFRRLRGHNNNNSSSEKHSLVAKEQQQDIESGMGGKWRRRENKNTAQNATKAAKKVLAMESRNQLHYGLKGRGGGDAVAPINASGEAEGREPPQQQKGVGRREAARIAFWANPELSCEQIAQRVRQQQKPTPPPYVIVEPEEEANEPPLPAPDCSPCSSSLSGPALLLAPSSADVPSSLSATIVPASPPSPCPSVGRLWRPDRPPILRRKSAMASLLDPINIGSGDQQQPKMNMEGTGRTAEEGGGRATVRQTAPVMSTQAKWRHAVRKLQMNKREAGRIQAKKIDAWSRWAFPLSYLSFHAAYWYYYLRVAA